MNKSFYFIALAALLLTVSEASARKRFISAPRFARPIVEQWIADYKAVVPDEEFVIAAAAEDKENSAIVVSVAGGKDSQSNADTKTVYFAEYAVVPIVQKNSEAAQLVASQRWDDKFVKQLFFVADDGPDTKKRKKALTESLTIYTGNSSSSVSQGFATFFGKPLSSFRGKRIVGDDQFLIAALSKDQLGISINTLPNLYDLNTRRLNDKFCIVPLEVGKSVREVLDDKATLDELIAAIEADRDSGIPLGQVGLTFNDDDMAVTEFVAWVMEKGRTYNHQYGLLDVDDMFAANQTFELRKALTAQNQ